MEGRTLAHFRILAKIGEGGMGVVYRAEDVHLRRPVALKVLPPDVVGSEERRARFLREARAAAAVPHPNIATIYEIGEADGVVFIAMELVEGTTLRSRLGASPLTVKDAVQIALQIAEGLAGAHQSHVVHRDLKPENVAITPAGHVKILDFGLAKLLHDNPGAEGHGLTALRTISGQMTDAGKILGTTTYMSPEQARGEAIDARSDIFSFGTVLYEMVTGRAPFQGRTSTDVLSSIIRDEPTPAAEINPSVPPELQRIIGECLEKDPHERYQHADQLVVDLRKLTRSTDSAAPVARTASGSVSAAPRTTPLRWLGGGRRRVLAGAGACLLLAAGFGVWRALRPEPGFDRREGIVVADFENRTGHPEFDTAVRDAFENLLSRSTYVDVIRGDRLKSVLAVRSGDPVPTLDRRALDRVCAGGKCAFIIGRIDPEGGSFRLQIDLFRAGRGAPVFTRSATIRSEQACLEVLHHIGIDLRRAAGEAPGAIALTDAPTTRSLAAFQAYASATIEAESGRNDTALGLDRRAVAIDPEFVDAYTGLAHDYMNLGDFPAARASAEQVLRRSVKLPERRRLMAQILHLDTQFDLGPEIELLKSCRRLYPYSDVAANLLGWLYMFALDDHVSAEPHLHAAYELNPNFGNFDNLTFSLFIQGKEDEIAQVAQDHSRRTGQEPAEALLRTLSLRRDWKARLQALDRYEREGMLSRGQVAYNRALTSTRSGRLKDAQPQQEIARREELKAQGAQFDLITSTLMWLRMRLGQPVVLSQEELARAAKSLLSLRWWAVYAVEANAPEPLASLVARFEETERGSQSAFVREELQFARGCLAFVRGDLKTARRLLEPLAENTDVSHRFHVLARLYEAHSKWPEAAARYEAVINNPNLIATVWPALWNLDRFRLAQVYERLGDTARARALYERFADEWKDGDADIPELVTARQRLAALNGAVNSSR
jgi:tetratricopeptide (TPR) repeat protein/tRNA A-37 threonylcarbamoyl transferase component Bud32